MLVTHLMGMGKILADGEMRTQKSSAPDGALPFLL
jgi:hypothetical protein